MNRISFLKSLIGVIVSPSIIKDIYWGKGKEYNWNFVERLPTETLFEGNIVVNGSKYEIDYNKGEIQVFRTRKCNLIKKDGKILLEYID